MSGCVSPAEPTAMSTAASSSYVFSVRHLSAVPEHHLLSAFCLAHTICMLHFESTAWSWCVEGTMLRLYLGL